VGVFSRLPIQVLGLRHGGSGSTGLFEERQMADCLKLLHFHMGSQVTNIRKIKEVLTEAGRVYVELFQAGAGLEYLDVGGGLGIGL